MLRRNFLKLIPCLVASTTVLAAVTREQHPRTTRLIDSARSQIGKTLRYDPSYATLSYPGGDVPTDRGVCTDVIIRAYREAFSFDFQKAIHEDMKQHFHHYPKTWGLKKPDPNIDHRRVPNLQTFLKRHGKMLSITKNSKDYQPGDLVTQLINNKLPHILIVSNKQNASKTRLLAIHNIGMGTQEEDYLFGSPVTGHYRFIP